MHHWPRWLLSSWISSREGLWSARHQTPWI